MFKHEDEPNFHSHYCDKKFIRKSDLTAHLPAHGGEKMEMQISQLPNGGNRSKIPKLPLQNPYTGVMPPVSEL